ncbi:MAG: hypothetical protein QM655_16815, partial [Nocardioidaceae bacterium]
MADPDDDRWIVADDDTDTPGGHVTIGHNPARASPRVRFAGVTPEQSPREQEWSQTTSSPQGIVSYA